MYSTIVKHKKGRPLGYSPKKVKAIQEAMNRPVVTKILEAAGCLENVKSPDAYVSRAYNIISSINLAQLRTL